MANVHNQIMKFVTVRAPQRVEDTGRSVVEWIRPRRPFESGLLAAIGVAADRDAIRTEAAARLKGLGKGLEATRVEQAARGALMQRGVTALDAARTCEAVLGQTPATTVESQDFRDRYAVSWERYYCLAALGRERSDVVMQLRAAEALLRLAAMQPADKPASWSQVIAWRPMVPGSLFPKVVRPRSVMPADVVDLLDRIGHLHDEMQVLEALEHKVLLEDRKFFSGGEGAKVKPHVLTMPGSQPSDGGPGNPPRPGVPTAPVPAGVEMPEPGNWLLARLDAPSEQRLFNDAELRMLARHKARLYNRPEREGVSAIRDDLYRRTRDLLWRPATALPDVVAKHPKTKQLTIGMGLPKTKAKGKGIQVANLSGNELPRVHVLGIGDLIVVEEQVDRYEMGEVAHIENVMATETRSRTHVRTSETETTTTKETEETSVDEKSLQTTDRFELTKESQAQLETSLEVTAGAQVSASYGPVSVSANAGLTSATSASTGNSTASTLAREVVDKAVSTVTKRARQEQVSRVLNRIEETNVHAFVNPSSQHVIGVYRWIDKYYTVRAVNYGRRLMLEVIVPEPANGLTYAESAHADETAIPPPPEAITFGPEGVTRENYLDLAGTYRATEMPPPPAQVIYLTTTFGSTGSGETQSFVESSKTIAIPEGYKTTNVWMNYMGLFRGDKIRHFLAGNKSCPADESTLEGVTGSLSLSAHVVGLSFHIGWKVRCELMEGAYDAWRIAAWSALKQAYDTAVATYEDRLAARAIAAGVHVEGRNPEQNKEIVRNELKRSAIKFLGKDMGEIVVNGVVRTNEEFDAADATGDFDLAEARIEGMIIQFFEQAFEWQNMTWSLFPYFWANSARHGPRLLAEDPDPAMRNFLMAGAARAVVPVQKEYEEAVLNFFATNEVWNGGEPPTIDDPDYVSIVEELKQGRTNSFSSPIYYESAGTPPPFIVDEWEVKMPTSLIMLQGDAELPTFPAGLFETDATRLLDAAVQTKGVGANWRNSIVDLLALYGVQAADDVANRRAFASMNGYPGDAAADVIASVDTWCYFLVMRQVEFNGLP